MDDLATRIAAIISDEMCWVAPGLSEHLAQALIRVLGLREDTEIISAGWIGGDKTRTRYVTEWVLDE